MKKLFLSMVALMVATVSFAQNNLVATLSHGEDIFMYYGTYALCDAMNAAESGDVINLSGGSFQSVNITKSVILRGTGIDVTLPTYINGDFTINIAADDIHRLSMEGIRCTGTIYMQVFFNSPYFLKNQFYGFNFGNESSIKNAMFVNCRVTNSFHLLGNNSMSFVNSYVGGFNNNNESPASFVNCIILPPSSGLSPYSIRNSQLVNCIIYQIFYTYTDWWNGGSSLLPTNTIATNCLFIGYNSDTWSTNAANINNMYAAYNKFPIVFKTFNRTYSENEKFELTDEAKTKYLGNDGTEVGIYGGVMPYNSMPTYPQITKMNVANKTTADGKLSVEIEVSAAE